MVPPSKHMQFTNNNISSNYGNIEVSVPIAIEYFDCSYGLKGLDFCFNTALLWVFPLCVYTYMYLYIEYIYLFIY
jgi:hypothetical protein